MTINKIKLITLLIMGVMWFSFMAVSTVYAATSPSLGQADGFVVLAGEAVTNVPTSVITGNLGLSPAAGTFYDAGVTTAQVSGTIYAVDATGPAGAAGNNPTLVNQAKTDWTSAYNALSAGDNAACSGQDYGAVTKDLVGLSLVPGVYCANAFTLSGTLTLSGSGVWIFRSAATLVTSGTANVVGGDACNVWWKVPSSATLGANTSLIGNILASTSIGMTTGASLTGRVLASTGSVTLQSNTITKPTCTTTTSSTTTSSSTASAPAACVATEIQTVPIIIESKRVSPTSVFLSWGPYAGLDTFNVQYGFENGNWLYNTNVTGFSTTINDLPFNQLIWVRVAARDNCSIGIYGGAKLVGGAGGSQALGPATNTLATTGSNNQLVREIIAAMAGIIIFRLGQSFLRRNETV